jgi:FlaA1/EpsC-like NDP-sugar epimerase
MESKRERSIGIRALALIWQLVMVTISYWGWIVIWQPGLLEARGTIERYLFYNEFLLIGVLFSRGRKREATGRHHDWVVANRQSARQAFLAVFIVFLIIFALKDTAVSRSFLFSYLPWLYLSLLFSNYLAPRTLGRFVFSGDREERVALAGTAQQAAQLQPWLERKRVVGLRTVGLICPPAAVSGGVLFPVLGTMDNMGVALAGRAQQAAQPEPWLERERVVGLRTVGLMLHTRRRRRQWTELQSARWVTPSRSTYSTVYLTGVKNAYRPIT